MLSLRKPIDAPLTSRGFVLSESRRPSHVRRTAPCRASSTSSPSPSSSSPSSPSKMCSSIQPSLGVQQHGADSTSNGSGFLSNISVPVAVAGGAGLFVVWRLISQGRGSANVLIERGLTEDPRERGTESSIKDSMKGVKTMNVPELSEDQILANRERRRRQLADYMPPEFTQENKAVMESNGNGAAKLDSNYEPDEKNDNIEVPKDHPWAVSKDLSPEEEELLRERLEVSPRTPKKKPVKSAEDEEISAKDLL